MSKIYLASPYSHPNEMQRQLRWEAVTKYYIKLMNQGHVVYCPIAFHHPMAEKYNLPKDHHHWMKIDRAFIKWADIYMIYMIPGWKESEGIDWETRVARDFGKMIVHQDWE